MGSCVRVYWLLVNTNMQKNMSKRQKSAVRIRITGFVEENSIIHSTIERWYYGLYYSLYAEMLRCGEIGKTPRGAGLSAKGTSLRDVPPSEGGDYLSMSPLPPPKR
jgi:hypothetical protein